MTDKGIDKKNLGGAILLSTIAIIIFLSWYLPSHSLHAIKATNECTTIFKEKARGYFGDVGSNRFIYNKQMNTCLLLNIQSDETTSAYRMAVVDMINDGIYFYYSLDDGQTKDTSLGLTKDEAIEKVRSLGFIIF